RAGTLTAVHRVVAAHPGQGVVTLPAVKRVVVRAVRWVERNAVEFVPDELVVALAAVDEVIAAFAAHDVVALAGVDHVVARAGHDDVVATGSVDDACSHDRGRVLLPCRST